MSPTDKTSSSKDHAAAAGAYGASVQKNTPDQRELEAHVLLKSAKFLQDLQNDWDNVTPEILEETLKYNRQIWMMFYDTALENPEGDRPNDLRSNIINLANFIFKRELEIIGSPAKDKLDVLINVNREIAAGLMARQKNAGNENEQKQETKKPPEGGSTNRSA
jgi:flagellar protein FlaF